jgi:hypothetical protein
MSSPMFERARNVQRPGVELLFAMYLDGRGLATIAAIFASLYDYKQS